MGSEEDCGFRAGSGTGSAFIKPGSRKVAGETLPEALNPLQPVVKKPTAGMIARHGKIHLNRINAV